jgi:outer membrane protein assembly factor BamB
MKYTLSLILLLAATSVSAADWPQFHGPNSDNKSTDTGLLKTWPDGGPSRIWEAAGIGEGYSSVAIVGDRIYTSGSIDGACVITALDSDGKIVWQQQNGEAWKGAYPGTRGTPTVNDGLVYHLSGNGNFICLKADSGDIVWSVDIVKEFNGRNIRWGFSESPLIVGNTVFCTPGGDDVSVVALNKKTGEVIWKCAGSGEGPGYTSPILVDHEGLRQLVIPMAQSIIGVRESNGELLWRHPHKVYTDQNITTPLFRDGYVLISACGRQGTTSLELNVSGDQCSVETRWLNKMLDDKQGGIILVDDRVYGYAESQNRGEPWMCIDFTSGETIYQSAPIKSTYKYRNGCLTYADGMFYFYTDDGKMALVKPGETEFELKGKLVLEDPGENPTWAHPVVLGKRLYIRYGNRLGVYDVAERSD